MHCVMKIYFSGSISSGRQDVELYNRIVDALRAAGHEVLAGNVTNREIRGSGESGSVRDIFDRDMRWIAEAAGSGGALVAEVSVPSHGVGYEIGAARYLHRMPVICLYRPGHSGRCSAMLAGDPGIRLIEYTDASETAMVSSLLEALGGPRE